MFTLPTKFGRNLSVKVFVPIKMLQLNWTPYTSLTSQIQQPVNHRHTRVRWLTDNMDSHTPLLDTTAATSSSSELLEVDGGDYLEVKGFKQARKVFAVETVRIWKIALPIVFNILCQYGVNSITNIFVGHLGDIELSAISLINSVIGTFAFGFMVSLIWVFLYYS